MNHVSSINKQLVSHSVPAAITVCWSSQLIGMYNVPVCVIMVQIETREYVVSTAHLRPFFQYFGIHHKQFIQVQYLSLVTG